MTLDERAETELVNQRLRCVTLLLDCPLDRDRPDCPFRQARKQSMAERINWLKTMDLLQVARLLGRHEKCMGQPGTRKGK